MSETSRRKFIAVAGAGVAASTVSLGTAAAAQAATPDSRGATEPVVALIDDPRSSTLRLLVGEREVVVTDRDLVTRILNAAGGN